MCTFSFKNKILINTTESSQIVSTYVCVLKIETISLIYSENISHSFVFSINLFEIEYLTRANQKRITHSTLFVLFV